MKKSSHKNIDAYIASFPVEVREVLETVRATIQKAAPKAEEVISYDIPTFRLNGNLVHFAGYAKHIGFYPGAAGIEAFQKEIASYKSAKGSVQFPLDKPMPLGLITKIVKYRVKMNQEKALTKKSGKG